MKKILFALCFILLLFVGCNEEGKEGSVYLTVKEHHRYKTFDYYDDNELILPSEFEFNKRYLSLPGTYGFEYKILVEGDTIQVEGEYTLEAEEGEDAGFLKPAEKGRTRYYKLECKPEGADFYYEYL